MKNKIDEELIERVSKVIASEMYNDPRIFEGTMWNAIFNDVSQISENTLKTLKPGDVIGDLVVVPSRPTDMMRQTFNVNEKIGGEFDDNYKAMIAAAVEYK